MKNWKKIKVNMEKNMCVSFAIMPPPPKKKIMPLNYCPNVARIF